MIIFFCICFDNEISFTHPTFPPILAVFDTLKIFAVVANPTSLILFKISYLKKTLLEEVLNFAIEKQLDIVTYGYNKIEEDGTIIPIYNSSNAILDIVSARQGIISQNISPMSCNKLIKRELFVEQCIEYPVDTLHEDIVTTFKLIWSAKRVGQVSKCYYNWFIRGDSITGTLTKKHISDVFLHFDQIQSFLKDLDEFKNYKCSINLQLRLTIRKRL